MNEFQNKLKDFTEKLAENIYSYKYSISISILYLISELVETDSIKKFGNFFFTTQQLCIHSAILSITKIFELNKKSINNFIQINIKSLPILGSVYDETYVYFQGDFESFTMEIIEEKNEEK